MIASLCLWGLGIGYKFNETLNRYARNNFRNSPDGWDKWQGRIVLITGGTRDISFNHSFLFSLKMELIYE
jgi:hypothetical protein